MPALTPIIVVSFCALLGAYALYAFLVYGRTGSVSTFVRTLSHDWPIIPFLFGVLAGHFWFS
jgi:hypothetical protein